MTLYCSEAAEKSSAALKVKVVAEMAGVQLKVEVVEGEAADCETSKGEFRDWEGGGEIVG